MHAGTVEVRVLFSPVRAALRSAVRAGLRLAWNGRLFHFRNVSNRKGKEVVKSDAQKVCSGVGHLIQLQCFKMPSGL